jgi:hypothetical protein
MTTSNDAVEWFNASDAGVGTLEMLSHLVRTEEDAIQLDTEILSLPPSSQTLFMGLSRLKERRIRENQMSKQEFLKMFEVNPIQALEKLFQEKVIRWDVNYMKKKGKTAEYIYERHVEQPSTRFLTFVA